MRKILIILGLILLVGMISTQTAEAQLFAKKMPVGVKSYTTLVDGFDLEFKDEKGVLDKYNFKALDTSLKQEKRVLVFDRKKNYWRLPVTLNESMGIADKDGEEPLQRIEVLMGNIEELTRQKIE